MERGERPARHISLRVDDGISKGSDPEIQVNCAERMPVCQAVCCKLKFNLTPEEVEGGHVRWDLGMPYFIRQTAEGMCVHNDRTTGRCGIYDKRPRPCRRYRCAGDERIWKDFDNMVLNEEWLSGHLSVGRFRLRSARMSRVSHGVASGSHRPAEAAGESDEP